MNYILEQAVSQSEAGAQVLDVNVGAPGVDEPAVMEQVVKALQSVVSLPLQLDSSHADALERGLRVYNGKPIVNSVNGETEVLERVLAPLQKSTARPSSALPSTSGASSPAPTPGLRSQSGWWTRAGPRHAPGKIFISTA